MDTTFPLEDPGGSNLWGVELRGRGQTQVPGPLVGEECSSELVLVGMLHLSNLGKNLHFLAS